MDKYLEQASSFVIFHRTAIIAFPFNYSQFGKTAGNQGLRI